MIGAPIVFVCFEWSPRYGKMTIRGEFHFFNSPLRTEFIPAFTIELARFDPDPNERILFGSIDGDSAGEGFSSFVDRCADHVGLSCSYRFVYVQESAVAIQMHTIFRRYCPDRTDVFDGCVDHATLLDEGLEAV